MLISTKTAPAVSVWGKALADHWPEYAIEGTCLGLFMVSACSFGTLLGHPGSPVVRLVRNALVLRLLMGIAMGLTAVALIYSPFGKRSGAHMNPATTLTFFRLGKIENSDAFFYVASQFAGASIGVAVSGLLLRPWLSHRAVNYVVTLPGPYGRAWAFLAEVGITFVLMSVILRVANTPALNRYTGIFAGLLVMTYITLEAPISGMSMNPARTLGSALSAGNWTAIWIYFTAPPLGMLLAAEVYAGTGRKVLCAKLHHDNHERCIFRCGYPVSSAPSRQNCPK